MLAANGGDHGFHQCDRTVRQLLTHGGQRRVRVFGQQDIVEADHRNVLRHAPARFRQRAHRADRDHVGRRHHAVEIGAALDQCAHAGVGVFAAEMAADVQFWMRLQPGVAQCMTVAFMAMADFRQTFVAEEGDAAAAVADQMIGTDLAAKAVVGAHNRIFCAGCRRARPR